MNARAAVRRVVSYAGRMEVVRLRRLPRWLVEARTMAQAGWVRENRILRRIRSTDGVLLLDEEVALNVGRVRYVPTAEQLRGAMRRRSPVRSAGPGVECRCVRD